MSVTITIDGDGLSLKRETSLLKAGQIITFLGSEESFSSDLPVEKSNTPPLLNPSPNLTPGELIIEANAKTNAEKILVLGKYITDKDLSDKFSTKEVLIELKKIGGEPHNFARDIRTAISSSYIYPIDMRQGEYGVTSTGKKAIEDKFSNKTNKANSGTRRNGTGGKKVAVPPRQEVILMPKVTTLSGFPDFHDLPTKSDSILWTLEYVNNHNIDSLTPREVEVITDKLLNRVAQKDFSAFNKRNMRKGYVLQDNGKFKLQQKGINHLKKLTSGNDKKEEK